MGFKVIKNLSKSADNIRQKVSYVYCLDNQEQYFCKDENDGKKCESREILEDTYLCLTMLVPSFTVSIAIEDGRNAKPIENIRDHPIRWSDMSPFGTQTYFSVVQVCVRMILKTLMNLHF